MRGPNMNGWAQVAGIFHLLLMVVLVAAAVWVAVLLIQHLSLKNRVLRQELGQTGWQRQERAHYQPQPYQQQPVQNPAQPLPPQPYQQQAMQNPTQPLPPRQEPHRPQQGQQPPSAP